MSSPPPDRYAVVGHPVAHSQSPFIHGLFARHTQQAMAYERLLAPLDGFLDTVRRFEAEGGRGCNITVPFKFDVPACAHELSDRARLAEAANTLSFRSGRWQADNTDGLGLVRDLKVHAQRPLAGQHLLLVGAGGASAGVLAPLIEAGVASVTVVNRSPAKATALVQRHRPLAQGLGVALFDGGLNDATDLRPEGFDVVINGSASSLQGADIPVHPRVLGPHSLAVDMMYGPAAQPFLAWARAHGAQARDGLGMLVEQAAAAFALWRGVMPHTAPVLQALRERVGA